MIQQRAQNGQSLRYFIAHNVQIGGNYKYFHHALIKFWDKIYTPAKYLYNIIEYSGKDVEMY